MKKHHSLIVSSKEFGSVLVNRYKSALDMPVTQLAWHEAVSGKLSVIECIFGWPMSSASIPHIERAIFNQRTERLFVLGGAELACVLSKGEGSLAGKSHIHVRASLKGGREFGFWLRDKDGLQHFDSINDLHERQLQCALNDEITEQAQARAKGASK